MLRSKTKKKKLKSTPQNELLIDEFLKKDPRDKIHANSIVIEKFCKVDQKELLSILAGLSILPQNQNHALGLLTALRIAASIKKNNEKKKISRTDRNRTYIKR